MTTNLASYAKKSTHAHKKIKKIKVHYITNKYNLQPIIFGIGITIPLHQLCVTKIDPVVSPSPHQRKNNLQYSLRT